MKIPILYEDNHLLIVEKPVNIPVQEDRTGNPDLLTILKDDIKVRFNKPGNVYLGLTSRWGDGVCENFEGCIKTI